MLITINISPLKLFVEFAVCVELNTSSRPPLTPIKTPNDFFVVIVSFSMMAASSNTKIGTVVAMIDALTGEELFSPTTNSHWLIPTPQRAQTKSITKSFSNTFSFGMKKDTSQNIMQAKLARMMVIASGGTLDVNRYLKIGILMPNKILAVNIRICPFIFEITKYCGVFYPLPEFLSVYRYVHSPQHSRWQENK